MNDRRHSNQPEQGEGFNVGDVYFVLFRQKWIVLTFCVLAVVAAAIVSIIKPAQYESEAKLFIQYVPGVAAREVDNPQNPDSMRITPMATANDVIQNEIEFLGSLDVAQKVVTEVGADRILSKLGGGDDTNAAAGVVRANLITDDTPKTPSMLRIAFQNPDGDVARDVLRSIVEQYRKKSDEMHNNFNTPLDVLSNEVESLSVEVKQTEADLNEEKRSVGIISSLAETKKNLDERYERVLRELQDAQVELASAATGQQKEKLADNSASNSPSASAITNSTEVPPQAVMIEYNSTLGALRIAMDDFTRVKREATEGSPLLDAPRKRVVELTDDLNRLQREYPSLASSPAATVTSGPSLDPMVRADQLQSMTNQLTDQLGQIMAAKNLVDSKAAQITMLEHKLDFKSSQLKYAMERLEISNSRHVEFSTGIQVNEHPTPAVLKRSKKAKKLMAMAFGGCVGAGLALAFFIEMVLDRTVKRPAEVENKLKLPLFISIPDVNGDAHARMLVAAGRKEALLLNGSNSTALMRAEGGLPDVQTEEVPPWDPRHKLHKFYSGLRDRLIVNFEVRNLNHNPKLVGVTSCNRGAGVSIVAAGLAASLSETGDGNVLLVDMRGNEGASQQFHKGKPAVGDDALDPGSRNGAQMHENLFAANGGGVDGDASPATLSRRFAKLMPKLKASDYDYIIFDMPPVSQTSMTARLSGLMDMVLLVIESEKTNRDSVKRATALLKESKAHVSTVLNKVHTYVPTRLHQEYLDDEV